MEISGNRILDLVNNEFMPTSFDRREYLRSDIQSILPKIKNILIKDKWYETHQDQYKKDLKFLYYMNKSIHKDRFGYYFETQYIKKQFGRYYAKGNPSLQSCWRALRNTIIDKERYIDMDMDNACPSILLNLTRQYNIKNDCLKHYCENRKECLKEVQEKMNISRDNAKNLFIRLLFGGKYDTFISDMMEKEPNFNTDYRIEWLKPLFDEMSNIANTIFDDKNEFHKYIVDIKKYISRKRKDDLYQGFKKNNKIGSLLATLLFSIENFVNYKTSLYIQNKYGFHIDASIHDGFHIRLYTEEENKKTYTDLQKKMLCDNLTDYVRSQFNLIIDFSIKSFDENYDNLLVENDELPEMEIDENYEHPYLVYDEEQKKHYLFGLEVDLKYILGGVSNDGEASEKFYKLYPFIKICDGDFYIRDFDEGVWYCNNKDIIRKYIMICNDFLNKFEFDYQSCRFIKTKSYGENWNDIENTRRCLMPLLKQDADWLKNVETSSVNCLLFNNGWLDYRDKTKKKFHEKGTTDFKWDDSVVFFVKIGYDFDKTILKDDETKNKIKEQLVYNTLGKEQGDYLLQYIAVSLFGVVKIKKMLFCIGKSNSGKNTITMAVRRAMGELYGNFNADVMAIKKMDSGDFDKDLAFCIMNKRRRLLISNELDANKTLNGHMIKKIASGGDEITARKLHSNTENLIVPFNLMVFANDISKIKPYDDGIKNRVRYLTFKKEFVDKPIEECDELEMPKDDLFCEFVKTDYKFNMYFMSILIDYYLDYMENGWIEPKCVIENKDWVDDDEVDVMEYLLNHIEITENVNDFVKNEDLKPLLKEIGFTTHKIKQFIEDYIRKNDIDKNLVKPHQKKMNKKNYRGWIGMKLINDCDEENNDDY